jgi:site-specific recombinase XerD
MCVAAYIDNFRHHLQSELGLAASTIRAYTKDVQDYVAFLEHRALPLVHATVDDTAEYLRHLSARGLATSTVLRKMEAVRAFYRWLRDTGKRQDNPIAALDMPSPASKLPRTLSAEAVENMISAIARDGSLRDHAIMELLCSTGMRAAELAELRLEDFYPSMRTCKVRGKGSKDRVVVFTERCADVVQRYVHECRTSPDVKSSDGLFMPALYPMAIWRVVQRASKLAGLPPVHPHVLRHTFATNLLQGGANLEAIRMLLGHESLGSTQRYTHVDAAHLRKIHSLHPRQ